MQITISPKQQFLDSPYSEELRKLVTQPFFQNALTHAMAEMNNRGEFNSEQMAAVRYFIDVFANLGERTSTPKKYPVKRLDYSALQPKPEKKTKKD